MLAAGDGVVFLRVSYRECGGGGGKLVICTVLAYWVFED